MCDMKLSGYIILAIMVLFSSCGRGGSRLERLSEDKVAKQLLQGVWLDDVSDMPLIRVSGDTFTYVEGDASSMNFKIIQDSLYLLGQDTTAYKIVRQGESVFWLQTDADHLLKLHLSEYDDDLYAFNQPTVAQEEPIVQKQMQKDSVIVYDGVRYRGYVFINPSKYKVLKTVIDENGIAQQVIFYDNIIHICVYEGANELYGKDIRKDMFSDYFDSNILAMLLLSDMDFTGVDTEGYHYRALLTIPESPVSYSMNLTISPQGSLRVTVG